MRKLLCSLALVGMLAAPVAVEAQLEAGPFLAYHDDFEAIGVGGYIAIPIPQLAPGFAIVPDLTFFFPDDPYSSALEINGDLAYFFPVAADSPVVPFAFGGLNWVRVSFDDAFGGNSDTDIGLNLGGGVQFSGALRPFAGAKFEIHDGSAFVIFGGIGFPIGGGA